MRARSAKRSGYHLLTPTSYFSQNPAILTKTEKIGGLGNILGVVQTNNGVAFENIYGTSDFYETAYTTMSDTTVTGAPVVVAEAQLYGDLAKTNAAALDYANTWVTREGDVPALKIFTKVIGQ